MKPLIATLKLDGHIIAICINNLINNGLTFDECVENLITSIKLLNSLGFIIHPDKSIFLPKQEITFLGFNINLQKMEITLTDTKKKTWKACCSELLHKNNQIIRYVAKVIGLLMTSSIPGAKYGAAHYKHLEQDKANALKISKGRFDAMMILSPQSIIDVQGWYNNIKCSEKILRKLNLLLKFHLMQVVLGAELSATIFSLKGHLILTKWNTILMLRNLRQQSFP